MKEQVDSLRESATYSATPHVLHLSTAFDRFVQDHRRVCIVNIKGKLKLQSTQLFFFNIDIVLHFLVH